MNGCVHIDATYWRRNSGLLFAIDDATGKLICLLWKTIDFAGYLFQNVEMGGVHEKLTYTPYYFCRSLGTKKDYIWLYAKKELSLQSK